MEAIDMIDEREQKQTQALEAVETPQDTPERTPVTQMAMWGGGAFGMVSLISLLSHAGATGIVIAALAALVASRHGQQGLEAIHDNLELPGVIDKKITEQKQNKRKSRSYLDRALGRFPDPLVEEDNEGETQSAKQAVEQDIFTPLDEQVQTPSIERITVEQMVEHTERNAYRVYIGRSLTRPGNPAVQIGFYKRHLKIIGASQKGKSTMAACLIDTISQSHDPSLIQFAILDLEDRTGKLFDMLPHVARVRKDGRTIDLHARNKEEVLAHLGYLCALTEYRYTLPLDVLEQQPLLIVYLEEFVDLKNHFKHLAYAESKENKEQAKRDYFQFIYAIKKLAARSLKVKVQLLLCAQVDYRDDDLQEALVNVTDGLAFCLRRTAADAAGFYQTTLLTKNAQSNMVGQCVAETTECKDLILAPYYDLDGKLKALPGKSKADEPLIVDIPSTTDTYTTVPEIPIREQEEGGESEPTSNLLARALAAYDEGYRTQPAMANALGISPWNVRGVYAEVKRLRQEEVLS
jgi:hypothetical protein